MIISAVNKLHGKLYRACTSTKWNNSSQSNLERAHHSHTTMQQCPQLVSMGHPTFTGQPFCHSTPSGHTDQPRALTLYCINRERRGSNFPERLFYETLIHLQSTQTVT